MCVTCGIGRFVTGDFHASLGWMGRILNHHNVGNFPYFVEIAKSLHVLNSFELHDDSLESSVRSLYRNLKKKHNLHEYDRQLPRCLKPLPAITSHNELVDLLKGVRAKLIELEMERKINSAIATWLDGISWLESKIQSR